MFAKWLREYWIEIILGAIVIAALWLIGSIAFYFLSLFAMLSPDLTP